MVKLSLGMVQMNLTVPQAPERSSPVILSEAKDLAAGREKPFASLRVTRCGCSNGQEHFVQIEPCLRIKGDTDRREGTTKQTRLRTYLYLVFLCCHEVKRCLCSAGWVRVPIMIGYSQEVGSNPCFQTSTLPGRY